MKHVKWSRLVCAIGMALVVLTNGVLFAQSTTDGAIGGTVVDQSRRHRPAPRRPRATSPPTAQPKR